MKGAGKLNRVPFTGSQRNIIANYGTCAVSAPLYCRGVARIRVKCGKGLSLIGVRSGCPLTRFFFYFLAHSKEELMQWRGVRRLSVRPSVCKLLRKSFLLAGKWLDRHQTCTRWSPGKPASRVFSRSRSRSKVT